MLGENWKPKCCYYDRHTAVSEELVASDTAAISMKDPRKTTPTFSDKYDSTLCLKFNDAEAVMFDEVLMEPCDATEVINFVVSCLDRVVQKFLVHCEFGQSRSVACYAALERRFGITCTKTIHHGFYNKLVYDLLMSA